MKKKIVIGVIGVVFLAGCGSSSDDSHAGLVCTKGHDQVVEDANGKLSMVEFVCDEYTPRSSTVPQP